MRYHRQGYEIPVAIDPDEVKGGLEALEERFNVLHEQLYGFRMPGTACEIVNLRAIGSGAVSKPSCPSAPGGADASGAVSEARDRLQENGSRRRSTTEAKLDGEPLRRARDRDEFDSTTVVLPGYAAEIDANLNILINPKP